MNEFLKSIIAILIFMITITFIPYENQIANLSYAQERITDEKTVEIIKGAANPEVDITNFTPRQWYNPSQIEISINETVKWINEDIEPHTVTSGTGGGIASLLTNSQGDPTGLFDSGLFSSGQDVSIKFNQTGNFDYFCTIHPWMEGTVRVTNTGSNIPSFAVDESGKEISDFPVYKFTDNGQVEIGLSWTPRSIVTNEQVSFIMDFFQYPENSRLHLWPFNFVVLQDGKEIFRTNGISQVGSAAQPYTFGSAGETTIRIESVDNLSSFVQFGTTVFENPFGGSENIENVSNQTFNLISPLTLVYLVYVIIIVIPLALVTILILYKKQKI